MRLRRFKRLGDERGMTLIEVMVASALWVLTGSLVAGIMWSTVTTQQGILDLQGRYHAGRVALDRLRKELTTAFVSLHQSEDKRTRTIFLGETNRITFNTSSHEPMRRNARQSDQLEVEYRVGNARNHRGEVVRGLIRRVKYHIDDRPGRGGREELLVEGVRSLEFEYFDKYRERWARDWDVEVEDAAEMRQKLKELNVIRDQAEGVRDDPNAGVVGVVAADSVQTRIDEAQLELMDGMFLPSRVRVRLILEDPEDPREDHVLETQVEITMTTPLWY
jgi:general secretion pathway protein J